MTMTPDGQVTGYTQNDLNHCSSEFFVRSAEPDGQETELLAYSLISAICTARRLGQGATIWAAGDVYTYDGSDGADRLFYHAETKTVGFLA